MAAPPANHDPLDSRFAFQARLSRPLVNVVTQLKEALIPFGVHVVIYRGASSGHRFRQHFAGAFACSLASSLRVNDFALRRGRMPARNNDSSA